MAFIYPLVLTTRPHSKLSQWSIFCTRLTVPNFFSEKTEVLIYLCLSINNRVPKPSARVANKNSKQQFPFQRNWGCYSAIRKFSQKTELTEKRPLPQGRLCRQIMEIKTAASLLSESCSNSIDLQTVIKIRKLIIPGDYVVFQI